MVTDQFSTLARIRLAEAVRAAASVRVAQIAGCSPLIGQRLFVFSADSSL